MQASRDLLIGADIGSYRVDRALAHGGMGVVYLGIHPAIGSRVAIKVLSERCAQNPVLVERFFSEARAVNLIKHEAIINVLDMATLPVVASWSFSTASRSHHRDGGGFPSRSRLHWRSQV